MDYPHDRARQGVAVNLGDYCLRATGSRRTRMGRWQRTAATYIIEIVEDNTVGYDLVIPADELLARVDAAYPFGERSGWPYKAWLAERKIFVAALRGPSVLSSPDEAAACEVARDLVEAQQTAGPEFQALLAMAPNRLARKCGACGAKSGSPCTVLEPAPAPAAVDLSLVGYACEGAQLNNVRRARASVGHVHRELLVPHQARLVGHDGHGPLFGGAS